MPGTEVHKNVKKDPDIRPARPSDVRVFYMLCDIAICGMRSKKNKDIFFVGPAKPSDAENVLFFPLIAISRAFRLFATQLARVRYFANG